VTGGVRAFESSSAKPMSWCDGVQEPRALVAPGKFTSHWFFLLFSVLIYFHL